MLDINLNIENNENEIVRVKANKFNGNFTMEAEEDKASRSNVEEKQQHKLSFENDVKQSCCKMGKGSCFIF